MMLKDCFFDAQDRELLTLVNSVILMRDDVREEHRLFDAHLHPNGIRGLAFPREMRMALAVVNLLDSLEAGRAQDRLPALRVLYDEVLNSASALLRRNTARVLIQIMKKLVRAPAGDERRLMLAHDFRRASTGSPRVVRHLLARYHLVEMPEDWSQLSFDHHVHDANTKGRKNPTHLIMDAWLKGIRHLTVIYYNYVPAEAAREILQAAEIVGISVRIGIEISAPFRKRFVHFIWVPRGFADADAFLKFLTEPQVHALMEEGREASATQQRYVFLALRRWNDYWRHDVAATLRMTIPPLSEEDFLRFVGAGQPSLLHLAEYIHGTLHALCGTSTPENDPSPTTQQRHILETLDAAAIYDHWLAPERNPSLPSPAIPHEDDPDMLRQSPLALLNRIAGLHSGYRITLNLAGLSAEDVLELIWQCQGRITHLEIFNLKEWYDGKLNDIAQISRLHQELNRRSAPRLKRLIRDMIHGLEHTQLAPDDPRQGQQEALRHILKNIPVLQSFYKNVPLRTRAGTDSTSRSSKVLGMGLVFPETLTARGQRTLRQQASTIKIPIYMEVHHHRISRPASIHHARPLDRFLRSLPGCAFRGYQTRREWVSHSSTAVFSQHGNIVPLGGTITSEQHTTPDPSRKARRTLPLFYLNTRLANTLKVVCSFLVALASFLVTQGWCGMAFCAPLIWFAITAFRNIFQSVLAGGGLRQSSLLHWSEHVSWTRLCDSLMYTGFSVVLLEVLLRSYCLEHLLGWTALTQPLGVYTCLAAANTLYLAAHYSYRGLSRDAILGTPIRSLLSVPVALGYNTFLLWLAADTPGAPELVQAGAALISKTAADTVATVIRGYSDYRDTVHMRQWDYRSKFRQIFATFARLELLFPEEDALQLLARPRRFITLPAVRQSGIATEIIINALDLMYFHLYQPHAQAVLKDMVGAMSEDERAVLARSQLLLVCRRQVSRLFINGLVSHHFGRPLAFYLDKHAEYLRDIMRLCHKKP